MKKIVLMLTAFLLIVGYAAAQKSNVSKAKAKILSETPDTKAAKEAILLALKDPTTSTLASTWVTAGDVSSAIYNEQQKMQWTQKKGDSALMAQSLTDALNYYSVADSLDQLPDAKGKVKPKYRKKIVEKVTEFQRGFTDAGSYFYEQKDYKNALKMFDTYVKYQNIQFLNGQGLEKDTLIPLITYYCGLSATQCNLPAVSCLYYEQIKDVIDSKWVYARLCDDYLALKDTANMTRMYQLGAAKFPKEPFYVRAMINLFINQNKMAEAMVWINHAIEQDPNSAVLWNVKGRIFENDKKMDDALASYEKALVLDPTLSDALGNLGRVYYNHAVEEQERVNAIRNEKKYREEKAKLKELFEKARPYFEKAHGLSPKERDYVIALRGIYYNLDLDAKYQEMDALLKTL